MTRLAKLVLVVAVIGCKQSQPGVTVVGSVAMPIAFGDCVDRADATFVSGPRPDAIVDTTQLAKADVDDPPPPPEDEADDGNDESGGTGTSMALDEGKMGKADSDRAEGQYKMRKTDEDPQLARQQAIEAARNAGILGTRLPGGEPSAFDDPAITRGVRGYNEPRHGSLTSTADREPHSEVSSSQFRAIGNLDKAIIRRYIKRNTEKLAACYESQLRAKPRLAGTVAAEFFIAPDGKVRMASASGVDPAVASCVAAVIKAIEFPAPQGGGGVQVSYPFTFAPTDPQSAKAPDHELFAAGYEAAPYTPGASNPLRAQQAALASCMRAEGHYGAVVVALAYDAAGAVTRANVEGIRDPQIAACVSSAAKLVTNKGARVQVCGFAYGTMPLADLSTIDVAAGSIKLDGKPVAAGELAGAIAARLGPLLAKTTPPIALHEPTLIRATDATPMKLVIPTLVSVLAGGDDFVLATRHGTATDWTLLAREPLTFPIAPVPYDSGQRFAPVSGRAGHGTATEQEVSVLVSPKAVTLAGPRPGVKTVTDLAADFATLRKTTTATSKRIEIAGTDDATYGDVTAVIEAAKAAGFTDWTLTDRSGLSTPLAGPQ